MLRRLISIISLVISVYFAFKYRYRLINGFVKRRWLQKLAVSAAMQIPFIRDQVLGSVISYKKPQNI